MPVEVRWLDRRGGQPGGRERFTEFDSEREALIFVDGLRNREDATFEGVRSPADPDKAPDDPYNLCGCQGGDCE